MTELEKIHELQRLEVRHWFPRQCQDTTQEYAWYFRPSSPGMSGGFLICRDQPENKAYIYLCPISIAESPATIFHNIRELTKSLPCLGEIK